MWDVVKGWLVPGSLPLLLVALAVGALLARRRATRRVGRFSIVATALFYLALSLPFTARHMAASLQGTFAPLARGDASAARPIAVVLLDGDHPQGRAQEAGRVFRLTAADWMVVSGFDEIYDAALADGVPANRIIRETRSLNTREQCLAVAPILRTRGIHTTVLVASSTHMRRALGAMRAVGVQPVASPYEVVSRYRSPLDSEVARFVPAWTALRLSEDCVYEYGALLLYWARGWLGAAAAPN